MTTPGSAPADRLDSWKAIAEYLGRDVATVRRWELSQGLPVRRLPGGRGSSVFAFRAEVDAWLRSQASASPLSEPSAMPAEVVEPATPPRRGAWFWSAAGSTVVLFALASWLVPRPQATVLDVRAMMTAEGLVASSPSGVELWRDRVADGQRLTVSPVGRSSQTIMSDPPAVYGTTSFGVRETGNSVEGGRLGSWDLSGRRRWTFTFGDEVRFGAKPFGPPWVIADFAVDSSTVTRRIAVAAHHYVWGPSLIAVVDDSGRRLSTFAHSGWAERVEWLGGERLLIGGFSEARNGGMVALVDARRANGQGPEAPQSEHQCQTCGSDRPVRMVVMPRSEVNLASHSRFNRAVIELTADRVIVRTIEVPSVGQDVADVVYEFTRELTFVTAAFSQRYWEEHSALAAEGKLDHTRDRCPDRDGPRAIVVWTPVTGWRSTALR